MASFSVFSPTQTDFSKDKGQTKRKISYRTICLLLVHFLLAARIIIYNYQPITNKLAALSLYTISNLTMDNANRNEDIILQDASIDEGERIVVQGFRNLRSQTNWRYRGEAMTISEVMDLESLRNHIHGFKDLLMIVASATAFKVKLAHNAFLQGAHTIFRSLQRTISFLNFSIEWIVCYIQMRYLDMEDKLYYVRPRNRFGPPRFRRITDLADDNQSSDLFGFKIQELQLLRCHWRIPHSFRSSSGHVFTGEEAMLIYLYHIRTGTAYTRMANTVFGGDPRKITWYIREILDHLHDTFYHKISGDSMSQWLPLIDDFCEAIHNKLLDGIVRETRSDGTEIDFEVYIPFETFRIFGWLDDTDMQTTRPRAGRVAASNQDNNAPQNNHEPTEREELHDTQVAFYKLSIRPWFTIAYVIYHIYSHFISVDISVPMDTKPRLSIFPME